MKISDDPRPERSGQVKQMTEFILKKEKGLENDDASQGGTKSENWMVQEKGRFSKLRWGGSWWNEPEQCQHAPHWMN